MKKKLFAVILTAAVTLNMAMVSFAASWQNNDRGWWYQFDDGTYAQNTWQWIDGNGDGTAESYYFDSNGYLVTGTTTPDGYQVNQDGAWVDNGAIQQRAAGQNQDAIQILMDASKKTTALNSIEADINMNMSMNMPSVSDSPINMKMFMSMKCKDLNTSSMKYLATIQNNVLGQDMTATSFYTDGYLYTQMGQFKSKTAMNLDELMKQVTDSTQLSTVDYNYMKDYQMTTDEGGNKIISYRGDAAALGDQVNEVYSKIGMDMSQYQVTIKELSGTSVVSPDGYCKAEQMKMVMSMSVEGETADMVIDADIQYKNPGQPVDFTLPSTSGFEEIAR